MYTLFFIIIGIGPFVFCFGLLSCAAALRQRVRPPVSPVGHVARRTLDYKRTDTVHTSYSIPRRRRRRREIYSRVYYYFVFFEICFILLSYAVHTYSAGVYRHVRRCNVKRYCCKRRVSSLSGRKRMRRRRRQHTNQTTSARARGGSERRVCVCV